MTMMANVTSLRPKRGAVLPLPAAGVKVQGAALVADRTNFTPPAPDAALVRRALGGGEVRFRNAQGGEARLAVAQTGEGRFDLALDGQRLAVTVAAGQPADEALARIADYLSQLPPPMREGLKRVEIATRTKGRAAATAYGGSRIVFWQGMKYLRPSTFFHEMGHINAKRVYGHTDPADAWDRAQAKDGKIITDYAKTNDNEDFAEMMEAYWLARRGEGEHTLAQLREEFPARMQIIEDVVAGRPVETKDSDYWRVFGTQVPRPTTVWQDIDGPEILTTVRRFVARLNPFKQASA